MWPWNIFPIAIIFIAHLETTIAARGTPGVAASEPPPIPRCSSLYGSPNPKDCQTLHHLLAFGWPDEQDFSNPDLKSHLFTVYGYIPPREELLRARMRPNTVLSNLVLDAPKISTWGTCIMSWQLLARSSDTAGYSPWDYTVFKNQQVSVQAIINICTKSSLHCGGHVVGGRNDRLLITLYAKDSIYDQAVQTVVASRGLKALATRHESELARLRYQQPIDHPPPPPPRRPPPILPPLSPSPLLQAPSLLPVPLQPNNPSPPSASSPPSPLFQAPSILPVPLPMIPPSLVPLSSPHPVAPAAAEAAPAEPDTLAGSGTFPVPDGPADVLDDTYDDLWQALAAALGPASPPPEISNAPAAAVPSFALPRLGDSIPASASPSSENPAAADHGTITPLLRRELRRFMEDSAIAFDHRGDVATGQLCGGQGFGGAAGCRDPNERCVVKRTITMSLEMPTKAMRSGDGNGMVFQAACGPVHYELVDRVEGARRSDDAGPGIPDRHAGGAGGDIPSNIPSSSAGENFGPVARHGSNVWNHGLGGSFGSGSSRNTRGSLRQRNDGIVENGEDSLELLMVEGAASSGLGLVDPLKAYDAGVLKESVKGSIAPVICACNCTYVSEACCWAPSGVVSLPPIFGDRNVGVLKPPNGGCCDRETGEFVTVTSSRDELFCIR